MDEDRGRLLANPTVSRVVRWGLVAWSLIGVGYLTLIVYRYLLYPIRIVFPPLLLAMLMVYLLNPVVSWMERRGLRRGWASLITYLVFLGLVGVGLRFLVPAIAGQVSGFAKSVPALLENAQTSLAELNKSLNLNIDTSSLLQSLSPSGSGGEFIGRIFSFTAGVVHVAVVLVLGIVLGFYLLVDMPKIQRGALSMIPARRRASVISILERMGKALGGYFRGQLLVALFVGIASMIGLWIVGLPYWALVGMVAGLFNLIPLVGPFIGGIPALFIAFTAQDSSGLIGLEPGWPLAIGSSVALLLVQQIDNHIISPNVVARTVKLHPVTVMLGLLIAGTLLGLWGMLLAVPVVAMVKILMLHYWDSRVQWPPQPGAPEHKGDPSTPARGPGSVAETQPEAPPEAGAPEPTRRLTPAT